MHHICSGCHSDITCCLHPGLIVTQLMNMTCEQEESLKRLILSTPRPHCYTVDEHNLWTRRISQEIDTVYTQASLLHSWWTWLVNKKNLSIGWYCLHPGLIVTQLMNMTCEQEESLKRLILSTPRPHCYTVDEHDLWTRRISQEIDTVYTQASLLHSWWTWLVSKKNLWRDWYCLHPGLIVTQLMNMTCEQDESLKRLILSTPRPHCYTVDEHDLWARRISQ